MKFQFVDRTIYNILKVTPKTLNPNALKTLVKLAYNSNVFSK